MTFSIKNKKYQIPTSWYEVTYSQYLKILKSDGELLQLVSIFSGLDYEFLKKHDIIGLESVIACFAFTRQAPKFDGVTAQIGKYKLPINNKKQFDIRFESLAQFEDMRAIMRKLPDQDFIALCHAYPKFCAIYLQKIRDKEYDYNKAMEMVAEVEKMPLPDVMIAGSFFFLKLLTLSNGTPKTSPPNSKTRKVNKRGGRTSVKNSGRTRK